METFAERFKYARQLKEELKPSQLADAIGVTPQAVWNYENRPGGCVAGDLLFTIADALGVSPRWLATGVGSPVPTEQPPFESIRVEKLARALAHVSDDRLRAVSVLLGVKL